MRVQLRFLFCAVAALAISVSIAVLVLVDASTSHGQARSRVVLYDRPVPTESHPLTLKQAWAVALEGAQSWSRSATIIDLRSIEVTESLSSFADGGDGRRDAWQARLVSPDIPDSQLLVRVVNGLAVYATSEPRGDTMSAGLSQPIMDSDKAINEALLFRPRFAPVSEKGQGYGFEVSRKNDGASALRVVGSYQGNPAYVEFDATSGQALGAAAYNWSLGGIMYSSDAGQTWHASTLSNGQVAAIAPIPGQAGAGYAIIVASGVLELWKTADGGRSWANSSRLPENAGSWAYALTTIAASGSTTNLVLGTPTGLWVSADGGLSWTQDMTVPAGPPQWIATTRDLRGEALVLSISAGQYKGLYASRDLNAWQKLLDGVYRLSPASDRRAAVATSDSGSTTAYVVVGESARPVSLPIPALRVAGQLASGGAAVAQTSTELALSRNGGLSWKTVMKETFADLAASPDFPNDGTVIAAGFRTGIFRSGDRGSTWERVLASPRAVLPGSGEVARVTFLSPREVVAALGGIQKWQGF